jgi:phenylacetate-CoA ligase
MYRRSTLAPLRPHRVNVFAGDPVGEVIAKINHHRPDLLRSYGPYLEALFRLLDARGIDMHLPRVACYGSGPLTEEGKHLIRERFGIPVISSYSAAECFKIAFTCERGDGFHLHEDLCVTRTVSPDGRTLPPGQRGEVVISNLVNRATVLLNYRLGDVAACQADSCGCGRTTALLSPIEGRSEDILYLPDGTFVSPRVVWRIVKDHPEALGYQLVQHDLDRFELRLVTPDQDSCRRLAGPVAARLRTILGRSAVIDVRRRDPVEQGARKVRSVISLCGPPAR